MYAEAGKTFWDINQPYVDAAPLAQYSSEADVLAMTGSDAERFDKTVRERLGAMRPGFITEIVGTIDIVTLFGRKQVDDQKRNLRERRHENVDCIVEGYSQ